MSWLSEILNYAPKKEREGLCVQEDLCWEVQPIGAPALFLESLPLLVPSDAVLYLESTTDDVVAEFLVMPGLS